jgi:hypothetical protein
MRLIGKQRTTEEPKMNKLKKIATLGITAAVMTGVSGCSTAGPFVTNVSPDGKGGLIVEKNTVHFDWWTSSVSMGDTPTTQTIQVTPLPEAKQR